MGPTASGKTALALKIAEKLPVEIINVDSAQIYREMDIGAGKPSLLERASVPHHLMDILDPSESYSAAQFRIDALKIIAEVIQRKKIPLLVGGTFLYFKVLQEGLSPVPASDPEIRKCLMQECAEKGLSVLYQELVKIDPKTAAQLPHTDSHRIMRALEIYAITGKPKSFWITQPKKEINTLYRYVNVALIPMDTPRSLLHQRIALRFDNMLQNGFQAEAEKLFSRGDLHTLLPAIRAVGYRQMWHYLLNTCSFEEMRENAVAATRQLAKRQLTWMRHNPEIINYDFIDPDLSQKICSLI